MAVSSPRGPSRTLSATRRVTRPRPSWTTTAVLDGLVVADPWAQPRAGLARRTGMKLAQTWREAPVSRTAAPSEAEARAAVAALYAEHATPMLRLATVLLRDSSAAEDVVQDAFLTLYAAWPRLREQQAAVGYLRRSVVNGVRSRQRRTVVAARYRPEAARSAASAEETLLASSPGRPVVAAVRGLPTRQREVVLLRHYLDLSERETAEALGLRPGSVKAYSSRGLAQLRAALLPDDHRSTT